MFASRKKDIAISVGIVAVIIIFFGWLFLVDQYSYNVTPSTVTRGSIVSVRYSHLGIGNFSACQTENDITSIKNSSGQEMLLKFKDVVDTGNNIHTIPSQSGFVRRLIFDQLDREVSFFIEPIEGCGLSAGRTSITYPIQRGVAIEFGVLPKTPTGLYTIVAGGQRLSLTVK